MTIIIPDPRIEMPSLFYPGRKPVGKVAIDWANSLTRGLTCCLLDGVDLVGGEKFTEVIPSYAHDAHHGRVLSNGRLDSPTLDRYISTAGDFSFFQLAMPLTNALQVITGITPGSWFGVSSGHFAVSFGDIQLSSPIMLSRWNSLHVAKAGTTVRAGSNGLYQSSGATSGHACPDGKFGVGYFRNNNYQFNGMTSLHLRWNRALTDAEIAALHSAPYQQVLAPVLMRPSLLNIGSAIATETVNAGIATTVDSALPVSHVELLQTQIVQVGTVIETQTALPVEVWESGDPIHNDATAGNRPVYRTLSMAEEMRKAEGNRYSYYPVYQFGGVTEYNKERIGEPARFGMRK